MDRIRAVIAMPFFAIGAAFVWLSAIIAGEKNVDRLMADEPLTPEQARERHRFT